MWPSYPFTPASKALDVNLNKVLNIVRWNLHNCPRSVGETAHKTLLRPTLEYGSAAWDPYHRKDIQKLERVQSKAERAVCAGNYNPYASVTEIRQEFNREIVATRRKIARLSFM